MRIGLFGGTFDPLHVGHLIIAETVLSDFPLDQVLFIPVGITPHKIEEDLSPAEIRLEMVQSAIQHHTGFDVSPVEIESKNISYTIDTIMWFKKTEKYHHDELYLLMGSDSFLELDTWKDPDLILEEVHLLVVSRPGFEIRTIEERFQGKLSIVKGPLIDISSSEIRHRVQLGKSIRYWVPESVEKIIFQKGLYH